MVFFKSFNRSTQEVPTHIQTYREYKEALRQQRANVYKRDNSHTPSPDTPPTSAAQTPEFIRPLGNNQPELVRTMSGSQTPDNPRSATFSPPPPADMTRPVPGNRQTELSRPLHLNIGHEGTNSVKSAQKEAVLSYVMAKTSPSGKIPSPGTLPPPYRSPNNSDPMSPASAFRASIVDPNTAGPPPYRSLVDPPLARNPPRLPRQNPPSTPTVAHINGNGNGNSNGNQTPPHQTVPVATNFTVRREMEKQREEMEHIQQLRQVNYFLNLFIFHLTV